MSGRQFLRMGSRKSSKALKGRSRTPEDLSCNKIFGVAFTVFLIWVVGMLAMGGQSKDELVTEIDVLDTLGGEPRYLGIHRSKRPVLMEKLQAKVKEMSSGSEEKEAERPAAGNAAEKKPFDITLSKKTEMHRLPKIIYGTAWKKADTARYVVQALKAGFRAIDTACQPKHYNEKGVGDGIAESGMKRSDLWLQTKFTSYNGQDPENVPYNHTQPVEIQVRESLEVSLKNLRTDYIDSLVLHSPMGSFDETMKVWRELEDFVEQGKVKQIGISNCYDLDYFVKLHGEAKVKPTALQNRFYSKTEYDKELREFCRRMGISYQSFWTLTGNPKVIKSSTITNIATRLEKTPEQVFFRFVSQIGITPLSGTKSEEHMAQDLDVMKGDWSLTQEDVDAIQKLLV